MRKLKYNFEHPEHSITQDGWLKPFMASNSFFFNTSSLSLLKKRSVKELALFVRLVYIRYWHEALLSDKASLNDLLFLDELVKYPNVTIAKTARNYFQTTFIVFI